MVVSAMVEVALNRIYMKLKIKRDKKVEDTLISTEEGC